ncbi:MAG: LuxR C-terminal-related transcriptional regulator [Anaerolineae bacterium]
MHTSILTTKLHIARLNNNVVSRPRLTEKLNKGLHKKLTLISAPAGFGKTTLVCEWLTNGNQQPIAWLSLDSNDSNPVRFLAHFVAALQTLYDDIGYVVVDALQSAQPPSLNDLFVVLINDISELSGSFVLVLDDYHVVESQEIDSALSFLLDHMPAQMHLVITTREDPQLPLSKLRVRAQLTEIRADDLRFTPDEAIQFFNQNMGLRLDEENIAKIEQRTEGWIAGLQLAALSMQGHTDPTQFIATFSGSHRYVVDYLVEEVLNTQPEDVRLFLLQTSILERLNAELCEAITGEDNSQQILERLERDNLFLVPLDNTRQWYRYHHLFGDALQIYLENQYADDVVILHKRASNWYKTQDKPFEAIHHALASKDVVLISNLLESAWHKMEATYQTPTWFQWVSELPQDIVRQRPILSHGYAWSLMMTGHLESAEEWLNHTEQALSNMDWQNYDDEIRLQTLPASISCTRMYLAVSVGDVEATLYHAERALEQLVEDDEANRRHAIIIASLAHWSNGDVTFAEQQISAFIVEMQGTEFMKNEIELVAVLADMRVICGKLYDAFRAYEQGLQLAEQVNKPTLSGIEDLHRGIAEIYCEWNKLEQAEHHLQRATELGQQGIMLPDWKHRLNVSWAQFKIASDDYSSALRHLDEAQKHYMRSALPLVRPVSALKARIWIQKGQLQKAQKWSRQQGISADEDTPYLKEYETITLARLLLAQYRVKRTSDSLQSAKKLLDKLRQVTRDSQRHGSLIEIRILQAQCFAETDDHKVALQHLEHALMLAEPEDYVRIFVNEGEPMQRLLEVAATHGIMPDYVHRLLATFQTSNTDNLTTQLLDPLSERELEVLRRLPTNLTGPEIADKLMVSLSTIRTHTRNIYSKLDVNSRSSAVIKAQELGLL